MHSHVIEVGRTPKIKRLLLLSIPIIIIFKIQIKAKIDNTKTVLTFTIFNKMVTYAKKYVLKNKSSKKKKKTQN